MKRARLAVVGAVFAALVAGGLAVHARFRHDLALATARAAQRSRVIDTRCGPIELQEAGPNDGLPLLVIHGSGGRRWGSRGSDCGCARDRGGPDGGRADRGPGGDLPCRSARRGPDLRVGAAGARRRRLAPGGRHRRLRRLRQRSAGHADDDRDGQDALSQRRQQRQRLDAEQPGTARRRVGPRDDARPEHRVRLRPRRGRLRQRRRRLARRRRRRRRRRGRRPGQDAAYADRGDACRRRRVARQRAHRRDVGPGAREGRAGRGTSRDHVARRCRRDLLRRRPRRDAAAARRRP